MKALIHLKLDVVRVLGLFCFQDIETRVFSPTTFTIGTERPRPNSYAFSYAISGGELTKRRAFEEAFVTSDNNGKHLSSGKGQAGAPTAAGSNGGNHSSANASSTQGCTTGAKKKARK